MHKQKWIDKIKVALNGGGTERQHKRKKQGKLTARERIDILLDDDSFYEIDQLVATSFMEKAYYTDGVITGFGKINGRKVAVYSQDFTINGGSVGKFHANKITKIMDLAAKTGCPIVGIIDSGGARIQEGIHSLAGFGDIFHRNTRYSGIIPQISVVLGPCAGGSVYSPALTDFIFTAKDSSHMFITGPKVIKEVLHEEVSKDFLGSAAVHNSKSGVAHFLFKNEYETLENVRLLLSYLPSNYLELSPRLDNWKYSSNINMESLLPENGNKSYDIKKIIENIFDDDTFFEVQRYFAKNIVIGFARLEGRVVAIVANQSLEKAGTLDIDASVKAARFINFCDSFSIPIISFVDVPGFLPGVDQEHNGIIRHGAKLLYAYSQATTIKITLILRKAFGGAYIVMGSKHIGADITLALPSAQIAVMGAKGAVNILYRSKVDKADDFNKKSSFEREYEEKYLNPFIAAQYGYIDKIIDPNNIRQEFILSLDIAKNKVEELPKKKHGNIPL